MTPVVTEGMSLRAAFHFPCWKFNACLLSYITTLLEKSSYLHTSFKWLLIVRSVSNHTAGRRIVSC
jgi:hypothetical protein